MPCERNPQIFDTQGGSQVLKRCQIPEDVRDEACQSVGTKTSAPKYTDTGWARCQIQCLPRQVCIAL